MLSAFAVSTDFLQLSLQRCIRGLRRTEVMTDLWGGGRFTLVAPIDEAFDALPCSFDRLVTDDVLVEPCIDLFEYLVVRGRCAGDGSSRSWATLHGEDIRIGGGLVTGSEGEGRILASVFLNDVLIHAIDGWVSPRMLFR